MQTFKRLVAMAVQHAYALFDTIFEFHNPLHGNDVAHSRFQSQNAPMMWVCVADCSMYWKEMNRREEKKKWTESMAKEKDWRCEGADTNVQRKSDEETKRNVCYAQNQFSFGLCFKHYFHSCLAVPLFSSLLVRLALVVLVSFWSFYIIQFHEM